MTGLRDTDPEVARAPAEINIFDCVYFFTELQVFFARKIVSVMSKFFAEGSLD